MKRMKNTYWLLVFVLFYGCGENILKEDMQEVKNDVEQVNGQVKNTETTLEDLKWMEGAWLDSTTFSFRTPPVSFLEHWKYYPDSLSGKGISIKANDTTIMELLNIRIVNGKINYIARPIGEALIGFPLVDLGNNEATFANPVHEFPQKIKYKRAGDSLKIILSGITPQGERVVTFKMRSTSF